MSWTLTESLPSGLTPFAVTGGGVWNGTARTLTFSGTEAVTNTLAYSVACATSGLYTVTGALAVPHVSGTVAVAGDTAILNAKLVRAISGTNVVIHVLAAGTWPVTEIIPAGLTPSAITGGAFHSYDNGQVFWYVAAGPEVLSYTASGEPGSYALSGYSNAEPIFGDSVLVIPGAEGPAAGHSRVRARRAGPLHADLHLGGRPGLRGAHQRRARRLERLGRLHRAGRRCGRHHPGPGPGRAASLRVQSSGP